MKQAERKGPKAKGTTKPATGKGSGTPLGKANAMQGELWRHWLKYILVTLGPKYYAICFLCNALALRVTQAAQLQVSDFKRNGTVNVDPFKRHDGLLKVLPDSAKAEVARWKQRGIVGQTETKNCGARGAVTTTPIWLWPRGDRSYLFPSRSDAGVPHYSKNTVGHALKRVVLPFVEKWGVKYPSLWDMKPRSHSGKRHFVTWMVEEGVPTTAAMEFAGLKTERDLRRYADPRPEKVGGVIARFDRRSPVARGVELRSHKKRRA